MKRTEALEEMECLDNLNLSRLLSKESTIIALLKLIVRILAESLLEEEKNENLR